MNKKDGLTRKYFEMFGDIPPINAFLDLTPLIEKAIKRGEPITYGEVNEYQDSQGPWDFDNAENDLAKGLDRGFNGD